MWLNLIASSFQESSGILSTSRGAASSPTTSAARHQLSLSSVDLIESAATSGSGRKASWISKGWRSEVNSHGDKEESTVSGVSDNQVISTTTASAGSTTYSYGRKHSLTVPGEPRFQVSGHHHHHNMGHHHHRTSQPSEKVVKETKSSGSRSPSPMSTPSPSGSASIAGDDHSGSCSSCSSTAGGLSFEMARKCTVSADSLLLHPEIGRQRVTETGEQYRRVVVSAEAPARSTGLRPPHLLHPTSSLDVPAGTKAYDAKKITGSRSSDQIHSHLMSSSAPIDGTRSASPKMLAKSSSSQSTATTKGSGEEKRKSSMATAVLSGTGRLAARLLRRTHSAGGSKDVPSYALFLREKPMRQRDSKTTSDDQSASSSSQRKPKRRHASGLEDMKQRLRFLRRRHTDSSLAGSANVRPTPDEAAKWASSFIQLMSSRYGSTLFKAFLSREFSQENIEFWMAVEEYKKSRSSKFGSKAKKIFDDFIAVKSAKEINVDSNLRTSIQSELSKADIGTFDVAQRKIQGLLESDAYLRFLQCDLYRDLLVAAQPGQPGAAKGQTKMAPIEVDEESSRSSSSGKKSPETTL
ncbi:Regulator of G-protein signaling 3 [Halotydeus destructor]|nr:Regulator of G-protein signaling 3 [Halotydeus destructor]